MLATISEASIHERIKPSIIRRYIREGRLTVYCRPPSTVMLVDIDQLSRVLDQEAQAECEPVPTLPGDKVKPVTLAIKGRASDESE